MQHDYFSSALSNSAMYFEIILLLFLIGIFIYGIKNYKFFLWRFFALAFGVFFFEGLTGALWINSNLGNYAYIHNDISWVMTLTWTSLIIGIKFIYDKFLNKKSVLKEFIFVTLCSSILGLLLIVLLKYLGIFSYSPEMQEIVNSGITIFGRPLEAIVYFPVFVFSAFSFYKYWELAMYNNKLFEDNKINFSKDILISVVVIFLIGYLIHPLLIASSGAIYIYMIGLFIINLLITNLIINIADDVPLFVRYISGTFIFTVIGTFILSMFVKYDMLEFSKSVLNTYTEKTITIPFTNISDVEFLGILLFSYLIIAIIRYFKIITDNKGIILDEKKMTFKGYKSLLSNVK